MSAAPLRLTARSLACRRGDRPVFEDVSFDIASGQMLVITGPNGAGKSSLLRIAAGLLSPTSGTLRLEGAEADRSIGEHAHYAGHADAVKPALGVGENLAFWAALYGSPLLPPAEALALLGIEHLADLPAGILSAGQRRRLALARLFVSRRPIWVLDEPTSTLDKGAQADFAALMGRHLLEGGLILAATHADLGLEGQRQIVLGG